MPQPVEAETTTPEAGPRGELGDEEIWQKMWIHHPLLDFLYGLAR